MDTITTTDASSAPEANDHAFKPEIVFDDFGKIDLRVGTIIDAKKVEKADKLLQLEVDLGVEKEPFYQVSPCILIQLTLLESK